MQTPKNNTAKQSSPKLFFIICALVIVAAVAWALYALNKSNHANDASKTPQSAQNSTVLSVNTSLQQNGAVQVCSAGNTSPGNLTSSSTNIVYQTSKSKSDTVDIINKVASANGYGNLAHTTNGSADFYEGSNDSGKISFIVYSDRKYTTCDPAPNTDPNETAFIMTLTKNK